MEKETNEKTKYELLSKVLGINGLVLEITTLQVFFIPCSELFAIFFGVLAIIVSLTGLIIALKHNHKKSLIVGALITSFLGCEIS